MDGNDKGVPVQALAAIILVCALIAAAVMFLPGGGEELLVGDREGFARRHPQVVLDRAGIDEIMLFYVKGESK